MDSVKISVVIPLYNKVRHIARAINSVLAQTNNDFELIIVDDGSTDGSAEIVKNSTDSRIRLVRREHIDSWGGHAARNLGIAEARASLIAFLDADDEWLPEHLATLSRLAKKYPECGACATGYELVEPSGHRWTPQFKFIPESPWEGIIDNYFKSSLGWPPVWSSAVAVWKHVFEEVGLFPVGIKRGGDLDMWGRIALKYPISFSNKVSAIYHTDATNRICTTIDDPLGDSGAALYKTLKHAIETGDHRAEVNKSELIALLNKLDLIYAKRNLMVGNKKIARTYLRETSITRLTYKSLIIYHIALALPTAISRSLIKIKRTL
jgi:glycosyltransferase involved in cell wall biosynthesis